MPSESDPWQWKMRLFASADLVGSTAYKASQWDKRIPDWATTFRDFFDKFPGFVEKKYDSLPNFDHGFARPDRRLTPWKFLGDEALFVVDLTQHEEVASHVLAFKNALKEFPSEWMKDDKPIPLRLKGTLWIAGFPVTNREITIRISPDNSIVDFIGPSIDAGFRIAKFSSERSLALSADLAHMLQDAVERLEWNKSLFTLKLSGREPLKGVLGSIGYPVVLLHVDDGNASAEEKLLGIKHDSEWATLKDFLQGFIQANLSRPFIETDPDQRYKRIPDEFVHLRDELKAEERQRGYSPETAQEPLPPAGDAIELDKPIKPPAN